MKCTSSWTVSDILTAEQSFPCWQNDYAEETGCEDIVTGPNMTWRAMVDGVHLKASWVNSFSPLIPPHPFTTTLAVQMLKTASHIATMAVNDLLCGHDATQQLLNPDDWVQTIFFYSTPSNYQSGFLVQFVPEKGNRVLLFSILM